MIDIHAHLIPFVDDGGEDEELAYQRLKEVEEIGVTDLILTPHFRYEFFETSKQKVREEYEKFVNGAKERGIKVNLHLGREIHDSRYIKQDLESQEFFELHKNYALIEYNFVKECDIAESVYSLKHAGFNVIVAHFERYSYAKIETAEEVKSLGGEIQINAASVVGAYGLKAKKFVNRLLKEGLVDYVASDVHSDLPNYLKKAHDNVVKLCGEEYAEKVFKTNALKLINK